MFAANVEHNCNDSLNEYLVDEIYNSFEIIENKKMLAIDFEQNCNDNKSIRIWWVK